VIEQPVCLLADDEPLLLEVMKAYLEEGGFAVITAHDGAEAMRLIDHSVATIAAVVTGVRMPRADGWKVAKHARQALTGIPVVFMSGDSASIWSVEGVPNSVMLQKPFASAQLVTALSSLLNNGARCRASSRLNWQPRGIGS
jgi:DNA-binding response OmpR family regulator